MAKQNPLITVAIYLRGDELKPDQVSKLLNIQPSRSQTKGGLQAGSTKHIARIGLWAVTVKSDSRSVSDLIDELFQKIAASAKRLDQIEGVTDAHLDILFATDDVGNAGGTLEFVLSKTQIETMGKLGLSACITIS